MSLDDFKFLSILGNQVLL